MFTFLVQVVDVFTLGTIGIFLIFFIVGWAIHLTKLFVSNKYVNVTLDNTEKSVSVIVPVFCEDLQIWREVLLAISNACYGLDCEKIVVANGVKSDSEATLAADMGFHVERISEANKRLAIAKGMEFATKEITVILDSDTLMGVSSIHEISLAFIGKIGGVTPRHTIMDRSRTMFRRISDWLEDLRFTNTVKGQSRFGAVSCLPGRMLAIRTDLLKQAMPEFLNESFCGHGCVTGDDRFLTSWLLKNDYQTVYQDTNIVATDAPDTLGKFVKQRLRWSRSSLRETILSLPWLFKHQYSAFTVLADVFMRYFFLLIVVTAILTWSGITGKDHYLWHVFPTMHQTAIIILGVIAGFFISGMLKQWGHLRRYPQDWKYLPAFLFITTFVLFPVELWGNVTCWKNGWMTRSR